MSVFSLPGPAGLILAAAALAGPLPPGEVRKVAEEVLGSPDYAGDATALELDEGFVRSAIQLLGKVVEWVLGLGTGLASLQFTQPLLFWTIVAALLAVLGLLLWHIVYSVSLAFRPAPRPAVEAGAGPGEAAPHCRDLLARADLLAASGDFTEAIRHLLLALLARFEERRLPVSPGLTNREIVGRLRLEGPSREALAGFVSTADRLWYGLRAASAEDFRRAAASVSGLLAGGESSLPRPRAERGGTA